MARELYSHSRLSSFEDCPKKFEYRYVLKLPSDSEGIEGFMGKRVHEVLERLYQFVAEGKVPSLGRVLERYRLWWDEHYDPVRVRIVRTENDANHYRQLGERCLTNYYHRFYPFDADETLGIEERVVFALDDEKNYRIQGIMDRLVRAADGTIEIHDYKTSARVPNQNQLDRDRQLALYQIGLTPRFGPDQPMRLVWHYVAPNQTRTSTRTREQLDELRDKTMGVIDRIRVETRWEAKTGPLCRWCEFNDRCPAYPDRPAGRDADAQDPPPPRGQSSLF